MCIRDSTYPAASSGEGKLYRSWCFPPGNGLLTGVGLPVRISPPAGECWPELGADAEAVLRRTKVNRRWQRRTFACSGEDNPYGSWCLRPGNAPLAGVGLPVRISPPAGECWPELGADAEAVLRRTNTRRRWQCRPPPAPARTTLTGAGTFLRGTGLSPELRFPVIVFFLRRNVSRSWQICGTRFNGEQVLIGAAERSSAPAPAKASLIGADAFLR